MLLNTCAGGGSRADRASAVSPLFERDLPNPALGLDGDHTLFADQFETDTDEQGT